jgi:hypothetical protein
VLHHCGSQQGVQTDGWEICAGVQLDHDECKYSTTIDSVKNTVFSNKSDLFP